MAAHQSTVFIPVGKSLVLDFSSLEDIGPDDRIIAGCFDVTWMFVIFGEVEGYPGYLVSSAGSVWSSRDQYGRGICKTWRKLKPYISKRKYEYYKMLFRNGRKGPRFDITIHRLVARVFLGPCPEGEFCLHNNDDKFNNNIRNLRYGTPYDNTMDSIRNGKYPFGSRRHCNKLSESDIPVIRRLAAEGWSKTDIGRKYGVYDTTILRLLQGKLWRHVP